MYFLHLSLKQYVEELLGGDFRALENVVKLKAGVVDIHTLTSLLQAKVGVSKVVLHVRECSSTQGGRYIRAKDRPILLFPCI